MKTWVLKRIDGKVFREDFADKWAIGKTAYDEFGKRFTKEGFEKLQSGSVIYKDYTTKENISEPIIDKDGNYYGVTVKKANIVRKIPFILVSV